jgi:hypothetical protein
MTQYTTKYQKELNCRLREAAEIEGKTLEEILDDPIIKAEIEDEMEKEFGL